MGLSSWSLDHIAFSWRVIPKAFRIKDPWESWNYQYVPELDGLITLLNLDGQVLTRWWSPTTTGAGDGGHAVWVDSHGDLYLNQNQEGRRLLKYRRCS